MLKDTLHEVGYVLLAVGYILLALPAFLSAVISWQNSRRLYRVERKADMAANTAVETFAKLEVVKEHINSRFSEVIAKLPNPAPYTPSQIVNSLPPQQSEITPEEILKREG